MTLSGEEIMEPSVLGSLGALFMGCVVSGVVPMVNAELLVVAAAVGLPAYATPFVVLVSALGQMISKTFLFGVARWAPDRLPAQARRRLERGREGVSHRQRGVGGTLLASALLGVPPFYVLTLLAGALRVRTATFVFSGLAGRLCRFSAVAWAGRGILFGLGG